MTHSLLISLTLALFSATLQANEAPATLDSARQLAWSGHTDAAVSAYRQYLASHPDDREGWLEVARAEGWRGNYPDALEALESYRSRFGEDRPYLEQRARALAWSGKPRVALAITDTLLEQTPDDIQLRTTRAIALHGANRPREALAELARIRRAQPDSKDSADLARYLTTPQHSSVTLSGSYGKDSDEVRIRALGLEGEYVLSPETRFLAGGDWQTLSAHSDNGLDNIDGSRGTTLQDGWLGIKHRFSSALAADLRAGHTFNTDGGQTSLYKVGADINIGDAWWIRPEIEENVFAVSPRAVSLGIRRESSRLAARWTPDARYTVEGAASYDSFSDGNTRQELNLAPRRAFWRTENYNIDLGLSARWFSFAQDRNNGYYDPQDYQRYALTSFTYFKLSDNHGISLALSLGMYKDNTMSHFKPGGDAVIQGFFGIYSDWYLRLWASLLHSAQQNSGSYRGQNAGFALTRRF